jgi:plasmid maintenance system antidote protein VapI
MEVTALRAAMLRKQIYAQAIAELLHIHVTTARLKISGDTAFTVDEAIAVKNAFFPEYALEDLFAKKD